MKRGAGRFRAAGAAAGFRQRRKLASRSARACRRRIPKQPGVGRCAGRRNPAAPRSGAARRHRRARRRAPAQSPPAPAQPRPQTAGAPDAGAGRQANDLALARLGRSADAACRGSITAFGMQAGMAGMWWPVAGLWLAAGLASFGLSVWVAICLILLGVFMDFHRRGADRGVAAGPAVRLWRGAGRLGQAGPPRPGIRGRDRCRRRRADRCRRSAGHRRRHCRPPGFSRAGFMTDFVLTAALYPLARFVIVPASIRVARR